MVYFCVHLCESVAIFEGVVPTRGAHPVARKCDIGPPNPPILGGTIDQCPPPKRSTLWAELGAGGLFTEEEKPK